MELFPGGGVVRASLFACTPSTVTPPPDAADAAPCGVDNAISAARLIRTADGSPLVIPCDAGSL